MSRISLLNDHLFDQLARLNNPDLDDADMIRELDRTKAITAISRQVIDAGKLSVEAEKIRQEYRGPASGAMLEDLT